MIGFKDLLLENIVWIQDEKNLELFHTQRYAQDLIKLRINDFPVEPLWTLFLGERSYDLEETPGNWRVKYVNGKDEGN